MKITRRDLLSLATAQAALLTRMKAEACTMPGDTSGTLTAGPMLLAGDSSSMGIVVVPANTAKTLLVAYAESGGGPTIYGVIPPVPAGGAVATHTWIRGLKPDTVYDYAILVGGLRDTDTVSTFRTPPAEGTKVNATIAWVSCCDAANYPSQPAWTTLLAQSPRLILSLGDFHYGNTTSLATHRTRYVAQMAVPQFREIAKRIPFAATYDDHDFHSCADGWGGCSQPGVDNALLAINEFFPRFPGSESSVTGCSSYLRFGDLSFYLIDGRHNRSQDSAPDVAGKSIAGAAQWAATFSKMLEWRDTTTFHFLCDGSTMARSPSDGYSVFTWDRDNNWFPLTLDINGLLHLSGDIHQNIQERWAPGGVARYPIYDLISSGIHTVGAPGGYGYFSVMDVNTTIGDPTVVVRPFRVRDDGVTIPYVGNEQVTIDATHFYRSYGLTIPLSELIA